MARTPNVRRLIEAREGSELAKKRLALFIETLGGKCSVPDACAELGVNEAAFHARRSILITDMLQRLEPRKCGPKPHDRTVSQAEVAELREKIVELERALKASQVREELAVVMPAVVKKKTASLSRRRRSPIRKGSGPH